MLPHAFQSTCLSPGEFTHSYDPQYFLTSDRQQDNKYKRCQRRVTGTREEPKLCLRVSSFLSLQAMHLKGATVNLSATSLIHCLTSPIRGPRFCQSVAKQPCLGLNTKIGAAKASWLTEVPLFTGNLAFSYLAGLHCPKNFAAAAVVWMGCVGTDRWLQQAAPNCCSGINKRSLTSLSPSARTLNPEYGFDAAAIR